jgi:hypothetical protein
VLFGDVVTDRVTRLRAELAGRPLTEPIIESLAAVMASLDIEGEDEQRQILARFELMRQQPSLTSRYLELIHSMRLVVVEFVPAAAPTRPTPALAGGGVRGLLGHLAHAVGRVGRRSGAG